jgi:hypothetical protein
VADAGGGLVRSGTGDRRAAEDPASDADGRGDGAAREEAWPPALPHAPPITETTVRRRTTRWNRTANLVLERGTLICQQTDAAIPANFKVLSCPRIGCAPI